MLPKQGQHGEEKDGHTSDRERFSRLMANQKKVENCGDQATGHTPKGHPPEVHRARHFVEAGANGGKSGVPPL